MHGGFVRCEVFGFFYVLSGNINQGYSSVLLTLNPFQIGLVENLMSFLVGFESRAGGGIHRAARVM